MKSKLYDEEGIRIPQTFTPSPLLSIFGYSVHGADYKKTTISIDDPLFLKGNGNYCNGEIYSINLNDAYASEIMKEDANRVALPWQNPDIYLKAGIVCTSAGIIALIAMGLIMFFLAGQINILMVLFSVIALLVSFIFVILYLVAMFFYRIQMRSTARDICNYYVNLSRKKGKEKEVKSTEDDEENLLLSQSKYYSACPNCGAVRFGNYEKCKMCGSSLHLPDEEIA